MEYEREWGSDPTKGPWTDDEVEEQLGLAFAPIHKLAFGVALGTVAGLSISLLTMADLLMDNEGVVTLSLLSLYFAGYQESWPGVVVGGLWGFGVGAVAGWFVAFVRNLLLGLWLIIARSRAELHATRDFLDHI